MNNQDHVIVKTDESCYGSMGQLGNITKEVILILDSEDAAKNELKKDYCRFRGNSTGSVSYSSRKREESDKLNNPIHTKK